MHHTKTGKQVWTEDFLTKLCFCAKIEFLSKIWIFVQTFDFCPKIGFLSIIWMLVQTFDFGLKFGRLSKLSIFVQNYWKQKYYRITIEIWIWWSKILVKKLFSRKWKFSSTNENVGQKVIILVKHLLILEHDDRKNLPTETKIENLRSIRGTLILHQDQFAINDDQTVATSTNQAPRFQLRTTNGFVNQQFNTLMPKLYVW